MAKNSKLAWLSLGMLMLPLVSIAQTGENIGIDLRALSMGNAVVADPPGISSIHYNPAGLANIQGLETDLQGLLVNFKNRNEFTAPQGYGVFGYSDDPVVCNEPIINADKLCPNFKPYAVSKINSLSLYVPVLNRVIDLPKNVPGAVPLPSIAYKPPGSRFTYGTAVYAPLVAGYNRDATDPGSFMGQQIVLERVTYASPTVAYQADDNLALGAGIGLSYTDVSLNTQLRMPNELVGVFRMINEDVCSSFKQNGNVVTDLLLFGLCNAKVGLDPFKALGNISMSVSNTASASYNLGLLWDASDDFGVGLTYRSGSSVQLKGSYIVNNGDGLRDTLSALSSSTTGSIIDALLGFPASAPSQERGLVSMNMQFPASAAIGIKYKLTPEMQFNIDANWMNWGAWDNLTFTFDRPVSALQVGKLLSSNLTATSLSLPTGFKDTWSWAFGWEYNMTDRLKFRLGYEPRRGSTPMDKRNPLVPINNAQLFGSGIGYRFDPYTDIDLTLALLRSRDNIPANTSTLANSTGVNNFIYNPYAGLDIKTNTLITIMGIAYRTRW